MDDEKYEISYHEFYCPLCRATLTTEIYFREFEKGSFESVKVENDKKETYGRFIINHYKNMHGVDFSESKYHVGVENDA